MKNTLCRSFLFHRLLGMRRFKRFLAAGFVGAVLCGGAVAAPVVTNVSAVQHPTLKTVTVSYDLAHAEAVKVTLEVSENDGNTFHVAASSVAGDVGLAVTPGTGKAMVWDAGTDWNDEASAVMRFRVVADDLGDGFAFIPSGPVTIGVTSGDTDADAPPTPVTVSAFQMGTTEVTKGLWDTVRAWGLLNGFDDLSVGSGKAAGHPVHSVSWWDAVKWCNARSLMEGLTPCYTVAGVTLMSGTTLPDVEPAATGYRLPTEVEWETAARGGVSGARYPWGTDVISHVEANYYSWGTGFGNVEVEGVFHPVYGAVATPYTAPVGSFAPNGLGLHDVAGNVWEWCWNWFDTNYYLGLSGAVDPAGPGTGTTRAVRGGSWSNNSVAGQVRCSYRAFGPPTSTVQRGFRAARGASGLLGTSAAAVSAAVAVRTRALEVLTQPVDTQAYAGFSATLEADAVGRGTLHYQWRKDGVGLEGALSRFLTISEADYQSAATYDVVVTDAVESVLSDAAELTVLSPAPRVTVTPVEVVKNTGESQTFTVSIVTGLPPFTYQWRRNGVAIKGARSAALTLTNLLRKQAGVYDVIVKNAHGSGLSAPARLSFSPLVDVLSAPGETTVVPGGNATFTVNAANATFQWLKDGKVIRGATGSSYTVTDAGVEAAGSYSVVVTTAVGKVTTPGALLRVVDAGLLIYRMSGSGQAYEEREVTRAAVSGYLLLDREGQRGGLIVGVRSGKQKAHRVELHEELKSRSTGPVPKTQTVINELVEDELGIWFRGADGVLQISRTLKGIGPRRLSGFIHTLTPGDPLRVEELKLNLLLDAAQTAVARQSGESVEQALSRLSQELQKAGSALQE
jgi:formylglycine-generating enzyme required for sulfatase activity